MSLREYAKQASSNICGVCRQLSPDILEEVNDGFRSKIGATTIRNWLLDKKGIDYVTDGQLRHHQRCNHHLLSEEDNEQGCKSS